MKRYVMAMVLEFGQVKLTGQVAGWLVENCTLRFSKIQAATRAPFFPFLTTGQSGRGGGR
jgi:hypothetical protein